MFDDSKRFLREVIWIKIDKLEVKKIKKNYTIILK
jgi:hypothetical protein